MAKRGQIEKAIRKEKGKSIAINVGRGGKDKGKKR